MTIKYKPEDCFFKLKNKSTCRNAILDFAKSFQDWEAGTQNGKYSFLQIVVPPDVFKGDPVLDYYASKKQEIRIFKMPANNYYTLHVDSYRASAINLLLNDPCDSVTFFTVGAFRRNQHHIVNLTYELKRMFWLGASWRMQDAIAPMLGFRQDFGKNGTLKVGYSYDVTTSPIKGYSSGTHEIFINYCFKVVKPVIKTIHENDRVLD